MVSELSMLAPLVSQAFLVVLCNTNGGIGKKALLLWKALRIGLLWKSLQTEGLRNSQLGRQP